MPHKKREEIMEYGFCTGFATNPLWMIEDEMVASIKAAGFDYPEFPVMTYSRMDEYSFSHLKEIASAPVACNLFPGDVLLSDTDRDLDMVKDYLDIALKRSRELGIEKIVFGSGKARRYSETTGYEEGRKNLFNTIEEVIIPKAKEWGVTILIEPLTRGECNLINTVEEGYKISEYFNDDSLLLMADLFHMKNNGESLSTLEKCFDKIKHVHIAGEERSLENIKSDGFIIQGLKLLKTLGYDGTISFETIDGDKKEALEWLKNNI